MYLVIASGAIDDIPISGYSYERDAMDRAESILSAGRESIADRVANYFAAMERDGYPPDAIVVLHVTGGTYTRVLCEPFDPIT